MSEISVSSFYPNGTEQFVITKGNGITNLYFYEGNLTFDAGFFVSSSSGTYTAVWNEVSEKWEQEKKDSFGKINVDYDDWKELLYSSEALDMVGMQSGPTEIIMQGREEVAGFVENKMLDFSYLNTNGNGFFIIDNGDYLFKIMTDLNQIELLDDGGPVLIRSQKEFYEFGVFKNGDYFGDPRVSVPFETFRSHDFILGGSEEVFRGEVLIVPKLQFMNAEDLIT